MIDTGIVKAMKMDSVAARTSELERQASTLHGEIDTDAPQDRESQDHSGATPNDGFVYSSWNNIALGIIVAGGIYPLVFAAIYACFGILDILWGEIVRGQSVPGLQETLVLAWGLVLYACAAGMVGLVWTGLVVVFTFPFAYLFAWSLRLRGSVVVWGAFCGGLVGFVAVLPLMFTVIVPFDNALNEFWGVAIVLLLGPGITTVLGQLGGAWGGHRAERLDRLNDRAVSRAGAGDGAAFLKESEEASGVTAVQAIPTLQFGIRHLLWIAVWLSLLLSVIRLSGIPFEFVLPLLVGWFIYQAGTLWLGRRLLRRWGRRERRCT